MGDEVTEPKTLAEVAAYPATEDEATAARIARTMAVSAQTRWHRNWALMEQLDLGEVSRSEWHATAAAMAAEFGVSMLLRTLVELDPAAADRAAGQLWADWEDGATLGEGLWEWLNADGIDPEQVNRLADAPRPSEPQPEPADPRGAYARRQLRLAYDALEKGAPSGARAYIAGALLQLRGVDE